MFLYFGKNIQSTWQIFCYVCEKNIIYIIYKKKKFCMNNYFNTIILKY